MGKVLVIIGIVWLIGELYFNTKESNQLAEEAGIVYIDQEAPINQAGNYITRGTLRATEPAVIPYLVEMDVEALAIDIKVSVLQDCEICKRNNKLTNCKHKLLFIENDSHEWNWQIGWDSEEGHPNQNYKEWSLPYESTKITGAGFIFRDSLALDQTAIEHALRYSKDVYKPVYLSSPPQEIGGKQLYQDSIASRKGIYYYGADRNNPVLGDIKISINAITSKEDSLTDQSFGLHGIYQEVGEYSPHRGKYVLLSGYYALESIALKRVGNYHSGSTFAYKWLLRILLGIVLIFLFFGNRK
jgi:hypothetical protein